MSPVLRRRGVALEDAIYDATLAELAEKTLDGLSFDVIAARAEAGKASIYRRWDSPEELVLAALARHEELASVSDVPAGTRLNPTGDLREELVGFLLDMVEGLATPVGRVLPSLLLQRERRPLLWERVVGLLVEPRQRLVAEAFERAVERGEIEPAAVTAARIGAGPAVLMARYLTSGPLSREEVTAVVDEVVLPSVRWVGRVRG